MAQSPTTKDFFDVPVKLDARLGRVERSLRDLWQSGVPPSGTAGGVLSGNFPNPDFAQDMATQSELNAHEADTTNVHGIADTTQLVLTTDGRLTNARVPTGAAGGDLTGTYPNPTIAAKAVDNVKISSVQGALTFDSGGAGLTFPGDGSGLTFSGTAAANTVLTADGAGGASWAVFQSDLTPAVILAPASGARNLIQPTADVVPVTIRGRAAGQTANLQEWQDNGGGVVAKVGADGTFRGLYGVFGGAGSSVVGVHTVYTQANGNIGSVVKASGSGQTADLQQWRKSDDTILAGVSAAGRWFVGGSSAIPAPVGGASFSIYSLNGANGVVAIRAAAVQSGDLLVVQDNAGAVLARITSTGEFQQGSTPVLLAGPAGGDLTGTLPNPQIADRAVENVNISSVQGALIFDGGGAGLTFPAGGGGLTFSGAAAAGTALLSDGAGGAYWGGASPAGAAGGDLGGTYPNPTVVKASGDFTVAGHVFLSNGTKGFYQRNAPDVNQIALGVRLSTDGVDRIRISSGARVELSDGASAPDVAHYRTSGGGWRIDAPAGVQVSGSPIVDTGPYASRPAAAASNDGLGYLSADLIFAAGGGGLTFPSSGGLRFGAHDGELSVSDSGAWNTAQPGTEAEHIVGTTGEPNFINGWGSPVTFYKPLGFRRDRDGVVHVQGSLGSGTDNSVAFTLPAAYRPAYRMIFVGHGYDGSLRIVRTTIAPDGSVTVDTDGTTTGECHIDAHYPVGV